jgi:RND superfamily putative drug exporter
MTRLARWSFSHRRIVLAAWLLLLVVALGSARAAGSAFNSDLSLPDTDSQAAVSLLTQHFPAASGETDQVVIQATGGAAIDSPPVRSAVTAALAKVSALPGITSVISPYTAAGAAQVSRNGTVAFARVIWDAQPAEVTAADAHALIAAAQTADGASVHVSLGGASITNSERAKPGPSVVAGIIAALAILLIVFGGETVRSSWPASCALPPTWPPSTGCWRRRRIPGGSRRRPPRRSHPTTTR